MSAARLGRLAAATAAILAAAWWLGADTFRARRTRGGPIRIAFWGSYQEYKMWREILAAFGRRHPDIPTKAEYVVGQRYEAKIQQLLVADAAPDVLLFQDEPFPNFARTGKFAPLDAFMQTPGYRIDLKHDYYPTAWQSFVYEGRTYGIPIWGGANLIFINKPCFRAARRYHLEHDGVAKPDWPADDWTMDEFLQTCRDLTIDFDGDGRIDQFGFFFPFATYWLPWIWSYGAAVLDASHTRWALFGPQAERVMQLWSDMRNKYHYCPQSGQIGQMNQGVGFLTGRVAMFTSGPWSMPFLNEAGLDYDVVAMPRGPAGRWTRVTWDALVLFDPPGDSPEQTARMKRAWKLIHFATGPEAARIVCRYQRSIPALRAAGEAFIRANPRVNVRRFIEAVQSYARLQPISLHWERMMRLMYRQLDPLQYGKIDARTALARLLQDEELMALFPPAPADERGCPILDAPGQEPSDGSR